MGHGKMGNTMDKVNILMLMVTYTMVIGIMINERDMVSLNMMEMYIKVIGYLVRDPDKE